MIDDTKETAWRVYKNGNYLVYFNTYDGTKIRANKLQTLEPEYPESIDMCISHRCDGGCPFCYDGATPDGAAADLMNLPFLDTWIPNTEIAINLNDMSHPQLIDFLKMAHDKGFIVSGTIRQHHFMQHREKLAELTRSHLLYGIGISLTSPSEEFIAEVKKFPNAVLHVIHGITTADDMRSMYDQDLKVLVLGYKTKGRGKDFKKENDKMVSQIQKEFYDALPEMPEHFAVLSFDNHALNQLDVKRLMSEEDWNEFYMGDDGQYSFYVDAVNKTFSRSSLSDHSYPLKADIKDMFEVVQNESKS